MISLLPWYIYSRRIVCTCFNLMISLLPWYVYSGYEFIYKVYWKFYANHDISLLFVRIHFVFFRIAYPYFLDFLDIRVDMNLYTRCTEKYMYICFNLIISYSYLLDTHVDTSLYTGCSENYVWITIIRIYFVFQFIITLLFPWYTYSKLNEFIYRVYWKLCADCVYLFQSYNCISLSPWYTCRYEFIYRVYWKLCITIFRIYLVFQFYNHIIISLIHI